eukprot:UN25545
MGVFTENDIRFTSNLEGGNLANVVWEERQSLYKIYLNADPTTTIVGWFFFRMDCKQGFTKGQELKFSLENMPKKKIIFSHGHRPVVKEDAKDWRVSK